MTDAEIPPEGLAILSPLGFWVRIPSSVWTFIVEEEHPVMRHQLENVTEALRGPSEVRLSGSDDAVYLFYRVLYDRRWVCAVAKRVDQVDAFLITAYPADKLKKGRIVWPE